MAALLMPRRNKGMRTRLGCLSHKSDSCSDFTAILPDKPNRALKRLSTEEATRWADSFDVLLSHKYGVAAFRAFLKTEFSEENLEFWLACEEFKKTRSNTKMVSKAHRIFEEFVDAQAPREVRQHPFPFPLTCQFSWASEDVHSQRKKRKAKGHGVGYFYISTGCWFYLTLPSSPLWLNSRGGLNSPKCDA
uniref:Regulator of G-protein signaling 8 n=1 Tax=Ornithorhynchus anatinus TaxID=9258 RepID=A0A6I8P4I2_ORNAN